MSIPVQYTVVGCVTNGIFTSQQYSFQVESYIDGKFQVVSLDAYEGKTIQIDGFLSPGDHLIPTAPNIDSLRDSQIRESLTRCWLLKEEQHRWVQRLRSDGLI